MILQGEYLTRRENSLSGILALDKESLSAYDSFWEQIDRQDTVLSVKNVRRA